MSKLPKRNFQPTQPTQPTQPNQLNLASIFQSVAGSLTAQRENLNNADTYNHDHGNNMVEVFNIISKAMLAKQNSNPSDQLAYASQLLRQNQSGSAQLYAQGLSQASTEFKGQQQISPNSAINLIQALLGGGQASTAQPQSGIGDLLGSLLGGGNTAAQQPQNQQDSTGLDIGDLLNAGMAFMNTKSQGGNNMQAIVNALVSGSAMGNSQHRSQSGDLVVNSILQAISGMSANK